MALAKSKINRASKNRIRNFLVFQKRAGYHRETLITAFVEVKLDYVTELVTQPDARRRQQFCECSRDEIALKFMCHPRIYDVKLQSAYRLFQYLPFILSSFGTLSKVSMITMIPLSIAGKQTERTSA